MRGGERQRLPFALLQALAAYRWRRAHSAGRTSDWRDA
jgi:hypothetical protein